MGTLELIDGLGNSIADVRAYEARRQQVLARSSAFDDVTASRLAEFARAYPKIPAGILEAFARENMPLDHPSVRSVVNLAYYRNAANGPGDFGAPVNSSVATRARDMPGFNDNTMPGDYPRHTPSPRSVEGPTAIMPRKNGRLDPEGLTPFEFDKMLRDLKLVDEDGMLVSPVENPREYLDDNGQVDRQKTHDLSRPDLEKLTLFVNILNESSRRTHEDIYYLSPKNDIPLRVYDYDQQMHSPVEPGVEPVPYRDIVGGWVSQGTEKLQLDPKYSPARLTGNERLQRSSFGQPMSVKDAIRGSFAALDAPIQETYGMVRNVYGELHGEDVDWTQPQSDYLIHASTGLDMGNGLLVDPESAVAVERRRRERERGLIAGHAVTPGRWLADSLPLTADSTPWNLVSGAVDFTAQVVDPAILTAKGISKVSAARRMFEADEVTGLFSGVRRQFHGPTFEAYRQSPEWGTVRDTIVRNSGDTSSPYDYWVATGRKYDPDLMQRMYDADTPEAVEDLFTEVIGSRIRSKHDIDKLPLRMGDEQASAFNLYEHTPRIIKETFEWGKDRFTQMLPDYHIDATNKLDAATNLERWGQVAGVGEDAIRESFNMVAGSTTKNGIEQAVENMMGHTEGVLARHGIKSESKRRELTRLFRQSRAEAVQALMDDIVTDAPIRNQLLNKGIAVQDMSPHLTVEYLNRYIPLPDIDRVKRALADPKYRWLLTDIDASDIGKPRLPEVAVQGFVDNIWKPGMLLGRFPAWITRVVGEEQVRMAFSGLDSMFKHPLSAMAIMIGGRNMEGRFGSVVDRFGTLTQTPSGNAFDEILEHEAALTRSTDGSIRRAGGNSSAPTLYSKANANTSDQFLTSWADQIAMRNFDPISKFSLNNTLDDTVEWLMRGKGRKQLRKLREAEPGKFDTEAQVRNYLTDTLATDVRILTNNNPELIDAMRTGVFRGENMFRKGGPRLNPKYVAALEEALDDAPSVVKGFEGFSQTKMDKYRNVVNRMFAATMGNTSDLMSRSPAFRQYMWQETSELLPYLRYDLVQEVLENARAGGVSKSLMRRLERSAGRKGTQQIDSIDELETLAAGYALEKTKKLLYDASLRGDLAESLSIVAPFVNAWQELIFTWGRLVAGEQVGLAGKAANAVIAARRVQQVIQGGRNNGTFAKNQFGEEVFVFPMSEWYTKQVTGVPVPLTGRVEGMSMITDVWPGLGPVAAIPIGWMLEGKPGSWRDFYNAILPYGAPGERDPNQAFNVLSLAPSWMQKMAMAMSAGPPPGIDAIPGIKDLWPTKEEVAWDNTAFMNAQKDVMQYFLSTGEYDVSTREGMQELLAKSREAAKDLYYIRAGLQFFAPTAPAFEFLAQDKSGQLIAQWAVEEEFYNMIGEGASLDDASYALMDRYGPNILNLTIPKTKGVTYGVPRTIEARDYLNAHPWLRDTYPGTYGFFLPQEGEVDYSVLVEQYASRQADVLTPSQWLNLRNDTLANMEYHYYVEQAGPNPTDAQEAWLRQVRSEIEEAYPHSTAGITDKPPYEELIPELQTAIQDPRLADLDVTQALTEYFYYRDQAVQYAEDAGFASFARPNALHNTRVWLSDIAKDIMRDYPDFELVWSTTLSHEFETELR